MILFLKHIEIEGPGGLSDFFIRQGKEIRVVELQKNESIPSLKDCEAVISLGGPMNVYETQKYPFLEKEDVLLKEVLAKEVPFLGICLGAQLLAKAAGATVIKNVHPEIGWSQVVLAHDAADDPLFKGLPRQLTVLQWHEDTFNIPKKGILLATSKLCFNQAIRIGPCAWGCQFHLEMKNAMVADWIKHYADELKEMNITVKPLADSRAYERQAQQLYANFFDIIVNKNP